MVVGVHSFSHSLSTSKELSRERGLLPRYPFIRDRKYAVTCTCCWTKNSLNCFASWVSSLDSRQVDQCTRASLETIATRSSKKGNGGNTVSQPLYPHEGNSAVFLHSAHE